jgi:spore germination cell wall hydrolase CwlJ-like protein
MNEAALAIMLALFGADRAVDQAQLFCLAQNVWFEEEHSDPGDRLAIAHVVLNRVADRRFPDDVCSVVWQRYQFSWTHDGKPDRVLPVIRRDYVGAWVEVVKASYDALTGRTVDPTDGATHYHASYVRPYWAGVMTPTQVTFGHVFYRRDR